MLEYEEMLSRIDLLSKMYNSESNPLSALMISKLTTLEIGGWLEEFFDNLLIEKINEIQPDSRHELEADIKRIYNFTYKDYRLILMKIVGVSKLYSVEKEFSRQKELLSSSLGKIKDERDKAAHTATTYLSGFASPGLLKREFESAYTNMCILSEKL